MRKAVLHWPYSKMATINILLWVFKLALFTWFFCSKNQRGKQKNIKMEAILEKGFWATTDSHVDWE